MAFPGGFGLPGAGAGLNLDINGGAGLGIPGLGLLGGLPSWTGFNGPYIPSTPLGALGGIKGDLIIPIVAVGVAIFLLVLIVLAVKAALAWKISLLSNLGDAARFNRDVGSAPAPQLEDDRMMEMAKMVMAALYSDSCSKRVLCDMGGYASSTKQLPAVLRLAESLMPADFVPSLEIMRNSAEGSLVCEQQFPCGTPNKNESKQQDQPGLSPQEGVSNNEVDSQQAPQKRHIGEQNHPSQQQLPIPLKVTPRPNLLQGIEITNSTKNEVRQNVHKPTKFRPEN